MQLRVKKIVRVKKSHVRARLWDISLISMYEVVFLFFYCWRFIVLKNRLQFNSTNILHGYQWQANLYIFHQAAMMGLGLDWKEGGVGG